MTIMSAVVSAPLRINTQLDTIAPTHSSLSPSSKLANIMSSTPTTTGPHGGTTPTLISSSSTTSASSTPTSTTSAGRLRSAFSPTPKMLLRITHTNSRSVGNPKSLRGGAKLPAPTTPHVAVCTIPKKGKGIMCLRATPPHTSLFTELPLLSLPAHIDLFTMLSSAPLAARRDFYALHNRHVLWSPADTRPDTRTEQIWESNCLSNEAGDVIFEHVARLNHDCCPNAKVQLYEGLDGLVDKVKVISKRSIGPREEVTVDYLEAVVGSGGHGALVMSVDERREVLAREWGFWCCCRRCVVEAGWQVREEQREAAAAAAALAAEK
ncbi:hypothetical protein EDC01DRAFT_369272 [Geopyxis carbonaria]|nr:hypothetical protein EDC01DRAFT_369272 [Geopyxis carbonaria]